jgi:dynein heavy chain
MEEYLEDFNSMSSKPMSLVLFDNAIEHVARISRIINQPYGNALLVGVGGSGRKSLTTLAVSIADFKLFRIEISRTYGPVEWREDLKTVFTMAGVQNQSTVFLFDDTQIIYESFLEDLNGILNTGEVARAAPLRALSVTRAQVPNLFTTEEMVGIFEGLGAVARTEGVNVGNQAEMYSYFIKRVRNNLHVVLCLSPIGDAFRTRLRMFPALVNCCTIDWFTAWPEAALRSVAKHFLDAIALDEAVRDGIVDVCVNMQQKTSEVAEKYKNQMGRYYYVTPTSYLELINTFKGLLTKQRDGVAELKSRYDNGLEKIFETQQQVDEMQQYLTDLQPKLKQATQDTDTLLVKIEKDTVEANAQKAIVSKDEMVCKKQAEEANAIKQSCEADLAKVCVRRGARAAAPLRRLCFSSLPARRFRPSRPPSKPSTA